MYGQLTQETLEMFKTALANNDPELLTKAFTQPGSATTGLQGYLLEEPAKNLFPVLSPLRNRIPRVGGGRTIQSNWKAVTGINTTNVNVSVSEGNRGGVMATTTADYSAAFKGIGLEDTVSFEAQYAAEGFDDLRARATRNLLSALMLGEEALLIGGNASVALGTTPTPVGTQGGATGAMTARTVVCYCIALTYEGYQRATVAVAGVLDTVARTNSGPYSSSDTTNGGHAAISAEATGVVCDGSHKNITWNVAAVPGAFGYAWYTGPTGVANCKIAAVTKVNQFKQTADEGATQLANATGLNVDKSQISLSFDGLVSIAAKSGSNAYYKSYDAADLTADNAGGIAEIDTMLIDRWNNYRLSFTDCWLSGNDLLKISKKVLVGGSAPIWRINTSEGNTSISGGGMIAADYLNKITSQRIVFHVHPNLPDGKLLFTTSELPYALNGIPDVFRILTRQEYYAIEWPRQKRSYEYGVYADEVLQHYFPPSIGIIDNVVLT